MSVRDIRLLYAYNRWANARALAGAAALTPEQAHRDLGTSHRSVFGTLAHILWGEWRWLGRWLAPAPVAGGDPLACADLPQLRARWTQVEQLQAEFLDRLTDPALERRITYENPPGTTWTYPLGQMMQHVVNHSTYHRGQVATLLRQLGEPVAATDFLMFIDEHPDTKASTVSITVDELRELLEHGEPVTVLDVRSSADRAEWFIPGSTHVDVHDALWAGDGAVIPSDAVPADRPVVTVCGRGRTSLLAAHRLRAQGISARSLVGGMEAWTLAWNTAEVPVPRTPASVVQVRRTGKGCLSYVLGSAGRAAVIDASLDPQVYVDLARRLGWTIDAVLDTHVHADHLSRARTLADRTGATLYLPRQDRVAFPFTPLDEGAQVLVGEGTLHALRTPGHTFESTCYLLDGRALFTGDTLFLNAVGRPDLEASGDEARRRAHALYGSLQRIFGLPADTLVLPAHTDRPVPFDGQPLCAALTQVRSRIDLPLDPASAFVEAILARIPPAPANHKQIVILNEAGLLPPGDAAIEAGANRCAVS